MLVLLILVVAALVLGYFLGRGKTGQRIADWFSGLRAPKGEEAQEDQAEVDQEA